MMDTFREHEELEAGTPAPSREGEEEPRSERLDRLSARYARLARDTELLVGALGRKPKPL